MLIISHQVLPLVVVELSVLEHFDVASLHEQFAILDDEQRATDPAGVGVDPNLSVSDVPNHGDLRVDDVHLPSKLPQGEHQLLGIPVDAHLEKKIKTSCRGSENYTKWSPSITFQMLRIA